MGSTNIEKERKRPIQPRNDCTEKTLTRGIPEREQETIGIRNGGDFSSSKKLIEMVSFRSILYTL